MLRKSIVAAALLALPLLSACSNSQESVTAASTTPAPAAVTSAAKTTVSGAPTTSPGAAVSPGATTAPGGSASPGSGLTAEQISKALQDKGKLSATTADCVANIYIQEGLSDSGIQKIIDSANGTNPAKVSLGTDDLVKAGKATKRIATECTK
ncbi:hypothetical protein VMT65_35040 [Nocardia sp. CDC153]|uniref:hypothetical protein n=1 Tax=Nocardia sp. CDC153 TaxID=3112167 RepID=UPI002DB9C59B|nr:hypothetical protein [Nocardia sp. CDC153]MEC3958297.1 hypothetical protein [Nocardia sp. CDC153]